MELNEVSGIGPKTLINLTKLGIYTIDDLIRFYPYRYNVYKPMSLNNSINPNDILTISAKIISNPKVAYIRRNFNRLEFQCEHNNMLIRVVIYNRAYLKNNLIIDKYITLIGKYDVLKNQFTANDIKMGPLNNTKIEPVYHLVSGITHTILSKCINNALNMNLDIYNAIPDYLQEQYELMDNLAAIKEIHNPSSSDAVKQASLKLKYDELFNFMFKINILKYKNRLMDQFTTKNLSISELQEILDLVPFRLTEDQQAAVNDIYNDFTQPKRMNRLLLGDVGSGKTIVAFIAILINLKCGYQSAMLAPTEVLARQHYENFSKLFPSVRCGLLTGSISAKEKKMIVNQLANNEIDVIIGTHAIIEENVIFNNLGLVVTDEQHRFGVNQRKSLQNKGVCVDVLYTTATPIPRTYALTIYGDMDISMIKNKPKGRKEIETKLYNQNDYSYIKDIEKELKEKHQVYVIAPLIEDSESTINDINNIKEILENHLKGSYRIDVLHGKMKNDQKNQIMNEYKNGNSDILISTTVIEVGVDVSNSTLIAIFNAERFGLSTLHQLRGRVGRNELDCKCILISDYDADRLKVMCESNDGFYISECDFKLRGSGDLFGIRQSGDMAFKIANLQTDYKILLQCQKDATEFVKNNINNNFINYPYYKKIKEQLMNVD